MAVEGLAGDMDRTDSSSLPQKIITGGERVDRLFSVLNHRYRRYIIQRLQTTEYPVMVEQLAIEIAAREEETTVEDLSLEMADRIRTTLHHTHLPKLVEESILEYDRTTGEVFLRERATEVQPFLEAVTESEVAPADD